MIMILLLLNYLLMIFYLIPLTKSSFITLMESELKISLIGELHFFLTLQVKQTKEGSISIEKIHKGSSEEVWGTAKELSILMV